MKDFDPRMVLGFVLVFMLFILSETIALGKVDPSTSFGLPTLLECFKTLVTVFATWAFTKYSIKKDSE
jgi:hypothetical protein